MTTPFSICLKSITLGNEDEHLEFLETGAVFFHNNDGQTLVGLFTNPLHMAKVASFLFESAKNMDAEKRSGGEQ